MGDIDDGLNSYPQSDDTLAPDEQPLPNLPAAKAPYRRQTPHITQSPIDDVEPSYVTRERYVTLEQQAILNIFLPRDMRKADTFLQM